MSAITVIDLIRHGEPVGGRRYRGQSDDPLSDKGWRQMWQAVGESAHWDQIISSPLQRCLAFAEAVRDKHHLPLLIEPRFQELGYGVWEGLTPEQITHQDPERLLRYYQDPHGQAPAGAEHLLKFQQRVSAAWQDVLTRQTGKRVLIVAHAGVIRAVIAEVLAAPITKIFNIAVDNAGITRFRSDGQRGAVLLFHGGRLE